MLSFSKGNIQNGRAIAIVNGGQHNNKFVYVHDKPEEDLKLKVDPTSYLNGNLYNDGRNALSPTAINQIYRAVRDGKADIDILADPRLSRHYEASNNLIKERNLKELNLEHGSFRVVPQDIPNQRESILISGPSGSGKSHFCSEYIKTFHEMFPERQVFIFSKKDEDPAFDQFPFVQRVELESLLPPKGFRQSDKKKSKNQEDDFEPLGPKDFTNSLVVFDDCENINDKEVKDAVYKLKDDLLETGRSENVYTLVCSHLAMNYNKTRIDLNESNCLVIFKNGNAHHIKRLLGVYAGIDNANVKKIMELPSRWVMINKNFPMYVLSETCCFLL